MNERPKTRTLFRGFSVWAGIVMGLIGTIGTECGVSGCSTLTFLGGLQLGMGVAWNRCQQLLPQKPGDAPPEG